MRIDYISYNNNNMNFLNTLKTKADINGDVLFRTSDIKHLLRILEYGTDRAGYDKKKMRQDNIPYDNVILATAEEDIIRGEQEHSYSNSFKKFLITKRPLLILYNKKLFKSLGGKEYEFLFPDKKLDSVIRIFAVKKI